MLIVNSQHILAVWLPIEWREFARYFSWFPVASLDQEIVCYHKKKIITKRWKDIGSWVEIFLCRQKNNDIFSPEVKELLTNHTQLLIRDGAVHAAQMHVPLTGEYMGKEEYFTRIVSDIRNQWYVVVQSIVQTKDFPLIQRSITDPTLLETLVSFLKDVEKEQEFPIVQSIASVQRREEILQQLTEWCGEHGLDASIMEEYDIALLACDW